MEKQFCLHMYKI